MLEQIDTAIAFSVVMLMLSLIVTAVVQVISALTDLRGRNLASGLGNLFHQVEPAFRQKLVGGSTIAEYLAEIVVKHPAVAHAGTRAKAISHGELMRVLRDLCSDNHAAPIDEIIKTELKDLLDARVPDIFTRKTRVITVVISLLFVVVLQIDSGEILRQITSTPGLRAKLAAMSDTALSQANKIFDNGERATAALADVKKQNEKDAQIVAALNKETPHLTRCVDGKNWLIENIKTLPDVAKLEQEFDKACREETQRAMGNSYDQIRELQSDLEKTDLKIIPAVIGGQPVFDSRAHWWAAYGVRRHLLGTLVSIVFLSLGAPFWFNTLRQLSNLKPAISEKVTEPKHGKQSGTGKEAKTQ